MIHKILFSSFLIPIVLCCIILPPVHAYIFLQENSNPGSDSIYLSLNEAQSQGAIVAIDVKVNTLSSSTPAFGAAFDLDYDPAVLTYAGYISGNFFEKDDIPENGSVVRLVALQYETVDKLIVGVSQNSGDPGTSGSGVLLTLKFNVVSSTQTLQSNITFSNMSLINLTGQIIPGLNWYKGQIVQYPLEITTTSLPEATEGASLSVAMTASGGFPPYTWSETSGNKAPGLQLNASTGVISGTPTTSGTYNPIFKLKDAALQEVTRPLILVVNPAPRILTSSLPQATIGHSYNQPLSATGGTPPLSWKISSGTPPPGILLEISTGVLSGTPTASGSFTFTVRLKDVNGAITTEKFSMIVNAGLSISTESLPETTVGAAYSATLQANGGTAPYRWEIISGLPPGLSLISTTGEIVGIPSTAGNWQFTVTAYDLYDTYSTKSLAIMVNPAPGITTNSVSNLYQGNINTSFTFEVTGGVPPYTWSITSGNLPVGLNFDSQTGTVSGTPTTPGIYTFTLQVTDATGITSSRTYSWAILATPPGNVDFTTPGSENRVDGYDLIMLDMLFGAVAGSPGWNPLADFNGDGVIDDADFTILQENFGKTSSP